MPDYSVRFEAGAGQSASLGIYWSLLKPRVMSLVVFTAAVGLWISPGTIHFAMALVAILCIAANAGAAGAINMWYDRDIDKIMERTQKRPLPQGLVDADNVLGFGVFLTLISFMLMGLATNWVAAFLLLGANLFYVFIYTIWLKRRTPQNIVIGGAAGAFPVMIGWASVSGDISLVSFALFLLVFLWTPPHFWALALYSKSDYGKAGVPMLPNVSGKKVTKWNVLIYSLLMLPISLVPWFYGFTGWLYFFVAFSFSFLFILFAVRVLQADEDSPTETRMAKLLFAFSILYLFVIFAVLAIDSVRGVLFTT